MPLAPFFKKYAAILTRLQSHLPSGGEMAPIGEIVTPSGACEIFKIRLSSGKPKRVLISAGIHGDEPAGVESLCTFLEQKMYLDFLGEWEILLLPCLNPYGFERGSRENHEEKDLNRLFKSPDPPKEVALAQSVLQTPFDLTLELHEDCDSPGYYLYQKTMAGRDKALGASVLQQVAEVMPVNTANEIEGTPASGGVIDRLKDPQEMDWWPMALFALSQGTGYCMTLETSTHFPLETRVEAHCIAIRTALANY